MKNKFWFFVPFAFGFFLTIVWYGMQTGTLQQFVGQNKVEPKISFESPPPQSLRGKITSISGEIMWQSRTATESAKLTSNPEVLQGEEFETQDDANISFGFPNVLIAAMRPKSKLRFAQTLPVNLVAVQEMGAVSYKQTGEIPVSVRVLGLLIRGDKADFTVSVDDKGRYVTVNVASGSIKIAYDDLQYVSYTKTFKSKVEIVFDNTTRQVISP